MRVTPSRSQSLVVPCALLMILLLAPAGRGDEGLLGQEAPALEIASWLAQPEGRTLADLRGSVVVVLTPGAVDLTDVAAVLAWNDLRSGWWAKGLRIVALVEKAPEALPERVEFSVAVGKAPAYGAGPRAFVIAADGTVVWQGEADALDDACLAKPMGKSKPLFLALKGAPAKTPAALAFKKGKLAEARALAEAVETPDAAYVASRAASLLGYWQRQGPRAAAAGNFAEASACWKSMAKHFAGAAEAATAQAALAELKANRDAAKEISAARAYARLRHDLARARGKSKKIAAIAKRAERGASKKPVTQSIERTRRLAARLRADPATAALEAFIAKEKIKTSGGSWRNNLPKPPQVAFAEGKTYLWHLETNKGLITLRLFDDKAPMHVSNAMYLTLLGFYDGLTFHRVIRGFMAQGGCPDGSGSGRIGYALSGEFDAGAGHDAAGKLSAANAGPDTDNSQFFITFAATAHLDGKHTVYGEVIRGESVLKAIEKVGSTSGATKEKIVIEKATITVK